MPPKTNAAVVVPAPPGLFLSPLSKLGADVQLVPS